RPLAETVEASALAGDPFDSQRRAVHQDNVAGATFDHLELDGLGPYLVRTLHVEQNATVAGFALTRRMGSLAPFELHHQPIVAKLLLCYEIAVFLARNTDHAIADAEDSPRIVAARGLQEEIKAG